ncbi:MAG: fibronectin type III domain-containing protein [Verrucomicrobiia bacterium]
MLNRWSQSELKTMGDLPATMDLMWDPVCGAKNYIVQVCPDPLSESNWRQIGLPTKSNFTASNLTSCSRYWFRVAANVAAGQSPRNDQAMKMVRKRTIIVSAGVNARRDIYSDWSFRKLH